MHLTKDFRFSDIKAGAEAGTFTGRASVYGNVDGYGDVVMPGAFTKTLRENGGKIVVLNQHDPTDTIGMATLIDREDGLHCKGTLELDLPSAKDAYTRIKSGLVTGISIGYAVPPGGDAYKGGVRQLHEVDLWEISLVTFPANDAARIQDVKKRTDNAMATLLAEMKAYRLELQRKTPETDALEEVARVLRGNPPADPEVFARLLAQLDKLIAEAQQRVNEDAVDATIQKQNLHRMLREANRGRKR